MSKSISILALILILAAPSSSVHAVGPGDEGLQVAQVQLLLEGFGYSVVVDGHYGPQTERAVRSWQKSNGLLVDGIAGPITLQSLKSAARVGNAHPVGGLNGLPFAPGGLSDCDEMRFYREQAGLPDAFDAIGYRESRCRNEDEVRTFCCYGYWQNYISSHLSRHSAYRIPILTQCQTDSADDINSDEPLDKQRQACVTQVVYSISGYTPWRATA